MQIDLTIDTREDTKFVTLLTSALQSSKPPPTQALPDPPPYVDTLIFKNLDAGDIQISIDSQPIILIERKAANDLAASLNGGRYHEQKARLIAAQQHIGRVLYLIEGPYEQVDKRYHKAFSKDKWTGCIINTSIRDNIPVVQTQSMAETVQYLEDICLRLRRYGPDLINAFQSNQQSGQQGGGQYIDSVKISKKENQTPQLIYLNQLRQIPGVSTQIAQKIAETYPSYPNLIDAYKAVQPPVPPEKKSRRKPKTQENLREELLADLSIQEGRRLGPVLSRRIYNSIFL